GGAVTSDGQRLAYTPGDAFRGADQFTYTITDQRGASSSGTVRIAANFTVAASVAAQGQPVPGANGAVWTLFGQPSIFAQGTQAGWLGSARTGHARFQGIFSG